MKVIKKTGIILLSVLMWAIILVAALYTFTSLTTRDPNNVSNVAGYTPLVVMTDSMSPTFEAEDLIFIKTVDPSALVEGDIVTFHTIIENEYALNTHRIKAIDETGGYRAYTTMGDNNAIEDSHTITDGDIVGKYVGRVPKFGKVMNVLSSSIGFLLIIVLPMLLFFIYQVYHLIMVSINLKKQIAIEQKMEEAEAAGKNADADEKLAEAMRLKAEAEEALAKAKALAGEKEEKED